MVLLYCFEDNISEIVSTIKIDNSVFDCNARSFLYPKILNIPYRI